MASVTKNILHTIGQEVSAIDLVVTPEFVQAVSGTPIIFSAQGSSSADGSPVSISWELKKPVGSATILSASPDALNAKVYPDINGVYKVIATATNTTQATATAAAFAVVTATSTPLERTKPDSSFIGNAVSSFWRVLENKEAITSLWSEYINVLSGDYRKVGEVVLSKSINTIQPGKVASNILLKPELGLSDYTHEVKLVPSFKGTTTAFFSLKPFVFEAAILNPTTIRLANTGSNVVSGVTSGSVIEVYTTDVIAGKYTIKSSTTADLTLSVRTPVQGSTLKDNSLSITQFAGSNVLVLTPSNQSTIAKGDYLLVQGVPCFITDTPTTDPTLQVSEYRVTRSFVHNTTSVGYLYYTVPVSITPIEVGMTSKVYVPSSELGGHSKFIKKYDSPILEYVDRFTVKASNELTPLYIGTKLKLLSVIAGVTTTIASIGHDSRTGSTLYTVEPGLPEKPFEMGNSLFIKTEIQNQDSIVGCLIYADTITAEVQTVDYILDYYGKSFAAITTSTPEHINGKTNADWRVCPTITSKSLVNTMDYPKEGVSYGDMLRLEITSSLSNKRSYVDCTIVGAFRDKVSIEFTTEELVNTVPPVYDNSGATTDPLIGDLITPDINDEVVARVLNQIGIPRTALAGDGSYLFLGPAFNIKGSLSYSVDLHKYRNIQCTSFGASTSTKRNTVYITADTEGNSQGRVALLPTKIIRNTYFPVKETSEILSIPVLTEFVYPKQTSSIEGSDSVAILHNDGYITTRKGAENVLIENVDFFIQNETSFTGNDLSKGVGYLVESEQGSFIARSVEPGDCLICSSVSYVVKRVLNSTTIEVLRDTSTSAFEASIFSNKSYAIKRKNAFSASYIKFRPGMYTPSSPSPISVIAKEVVLDNIRQIENNFGRLVGYSVEEFYDYSSPQMTYLSAIKGLMYAITGGPTLRNIKMATSILLNLPVAASLSRVVEIDRNNGRIALQPLNPRTLQIQGPLDTYTFSTKSTTLPFTTMAINPITGSPYEEGDVIPKLSPLTGKVFVSDYTGPTFNFLTEFHTWKVSLDVNSIDSRDIPLLFKFYNIAKPVHTKPEIEVVLYLVDEIQVLAFFRMEAIIKFMDDPGFGLELNHAFDSNNNSGQVLRLANLTELSTATLLLGRDLVVNSSTEVTSNRGGFILDDPALFTEDSGIGVQNDVKELAAYPPFSGVHFVRGKYLVRPGDILRVYSGKNHGVYNITAVTSDTQLSVEPLQGFGDYSYDPVPDSAGSPPGVPEPAGAMFGIYRIVSDKIISGLTCSQVSAGSAASTHVATFAGEAFNWDRVSVGDALVRASDHMEKHTVLEIVYDPLVEDSSSKLLLGSAPTAAAEYFIYRDALINQEYATGDIDAVDSNLLYRLEYDSSNNLNPLRYRISVGDTIEMTSGASEGDRALVTFVENDALYIDKPIALLGAEFKLLKTGRKVIGDDPATFPLSPYGHVGSRGTGANVGRPLETDSDKRLEFLHGFDDVSITLTSTSAIAQVGVSVSIAAENITRRELIGITNVSTTDTVLLYSGNTLVFTGSVLWISGSTVMCASITEDPSLATGTQYTIEIIRRSLP